MTGSRRLMFADAMSIFARSTPFAVPELACAHPRDQLGVFLYAAVAEQAVPARARQCPPALSNIVDGLVIHVCLANVDEMAGLIASMYSIRCFAVP